MTKIFLLLTLITFVIPKENQQTHVDDRLALLTGSSKKSWYIYSVPQNGTDSASINSNNLRELDNTYTFFADGTFEFDRGTLTQDANCTKDCPSDWVNFVGAWTFTNNQQGIRITFLHPKGQPAGSSKPMVLYDVSILKLENEILQFGQTIPGIKEQAILEFRSK